MLLPPIATLQSPQAAPSPAKAVALDCTASEGLSEAIQAAAKAHLEQAGVQACPPDAPGLPVLRINAELSTRQDGMFLASVQFQCGTREALPPRQEGRSLFGDALPKQAYLALTRNREVAERRLKEGTISTINRALFILFPPPSGVIGGTGRLYLGTAKVRFQPPQPPYPVFAKIAGVQGVVRIEVGFDAEGVPQETRLLTGPDLLAEDALAYGMQWRFDPPVQQGKTTPGIFVLDITYHLN